MERLPISEMLDWQVWVQTQFQGRASSDQVDIQRGDLVVAPDITTWLKTYQAELTTTVARPPADVFETAIAVALRANKHMSPAYERPDGGGVVRPVVGSGVWRMNRTTVEIGVTRAEGDSSEILMRAAAKEGLIKQRSSEKALTRFRDELSEALGIPIVGDPVSAASPP